MCVNADKIKDDSILIGKSKVRFTVFLGFFVNISYKSYISVSVGIKKQIDLQQCVSFNLYSHTLYLTIENVFLSNIDYVCE